ncbi:hypothetical protein M5689_020875 [Euphorbia peplus]|nr:hypothetical protein M5689_020875 [Euphorbia peplus]
MESLRVAECPKKEMSRIHRNLRHISALESIVQVKNSHRNEDGVVRMKVLVRKEDLKQMLQLMKNRNGSPISHPNTSLSSSSSLVEQRLKILRRKHLARTNVVKSSHNWAPALHSIPE